ncbi:MAG: LCP family protein [Clostridia bacterium]|nr:LCP family protein [Clostridia bacterium]
MAEQKKKTSVKPKKTTAVSETGERRVVLSAKTDPLEYLRQEQEKLNKEIEKGRETDEALKEKLVEKKTTPKEFMITQSRRAANAEAEQAWEDAKRQMAQKSRDASFDWLKDDPMDDYDEEDEGIPISREKRQAMSPVHRRNRGYDRTKQILAIGLIFVAMFISVGGFVLDKMDLVQYEDEVQKQAQQTDQELLDEAAAITEEELKGLQYINDYPGLPQGQVYRDPDVINVLLLGTDERTTRFNTNARSDSMILVSIHTRNHTVKLVSFERGTGVPILEGEYRGQYDWLTHCFRYGGANLVMEEIQACYLLDVGHYVRTNIRAFMKLIDVVGGVDIYLSEAEADYINHWYNYKYATNHVREMDIKDGLHSVSVGRNHLNGETAMLYARCRAIDNDFGRMKRQRIVMQAIFNQIKDLSIPELNTMLNTILPLIQTNFTRGELATLVLEVPNILDGEFETMQLPESSTFGKMTGMEGRSLFAVDFQRNSDDLKAFLYE